MTLHLRSKPQVDSFVLQLSLVALSSCSLLFDLEQEIQNHLWNRFSHLCWILHQQVEVARESLVLRICAGQHQSYLVNSCYLPFLMEHPWSPRFSISRFDPTVAKTSSSKSLPSSPIPQHLHYQHHPSSPPPHHLLSSSSTS